MDFAFSWIRGKYTTSFLSQRNRRDDFLGREYLVADSRTLVWKQSY